MFYLLHWGNSPKNENYTRTQTKYLPYTAVVHCVNPCEWKEEEKNILHFELNLKWDIHQWNRDEMKQDTPNRKWSFMFIWCQSCYKIHSQCWQPYQMWSRHFVNRTILKVQRFIAMLMMIMITMMVNMAENVKISENARVKIHSHNLNRKAVKEGFIFGSFGPFYIFHLECSTFA